MTDLAYYVKISLKDLTSHDLEKVLHFYHDADYWNEKQTIEIETVELEEGA